MLEKSEDDYEVYLYPGQLENLWTVVTGKLQDTLGAGLYKSWIEPLRIIGFDSRILILQAPTQFIKTRVESAYGELLANLCRDVFPYFVSLKIQVSADIPLTSTASLVQGGESRVDPFKQHDEFEEAILENDYTSSLDIRFTFENFVIGKPNELAYAAALRIAESEKPPFNPLFLYGGVGLGKTHLMHAIAWHIKKVFPKKKVIYLSAEKFMYEFVRALRFKNTVAFKEKFRRIDILMIDDVQFISGKETTQEEFFHTFNALVDNNHQIIVSADKSPSDLEDIEERLKSRLGWGLVADIHPTNYELRLGILQSKVEALKIAVPSDVLEFLAVRITSNIRELEGALNRIVAHATLIGRKIDLDTTCDVLKDLLRSHDRRVVTIDDIQEKVCAYYKVKPSDLMSSRRMQSIVKPRQLAMYLSKILTTKSFPEIGRRFGGRDHTTVIHAVRKIEAAVLMVANTVV